MKLFAIKFRYLGDMGYNSAIFQARNLDSAQNKIRRFLKQEDDIDKRTVSWAGSSVPLNGDILTPTILRVDLDFIH